MLKFLLPSVFCLFASVSLFSQQKNSFPDNPAEFIAQLKEFVTASKVEVVEETFKEFERKFKSGVFQPDEVGTIIKSSNTMLTLRMPARPFFVDYLYCLNFVKATEDSTRFDTWQAIYTELLAGGGENAKGASGRFLDFSKSWLSKNTLRSGEAGSIVWYAKGKGQMVLEGGAPVIKFEKPCDLVGSRKGDSIAVFKTTGVFYPVTNTWKGKTGKVTWARSGLDSTVYATLNEYEVDLTKSIYRATNVKLYYPLLFPAGPVDGNLEDNLVTGAKAGDSSFPKFESKERTLHLSTLGGGLKYTGGFRLEGSTVYGFGTRKEKARIAIFDPSNKLLFRGASQLFTIRREEKIAGESVASTIYYRSDSIFHPSISFQYEIQPRNLKLARGNKPSDRNPFYHSLYQINLDVDKILWQIPKDSLLIGERTINYGNNSKAYFESAAYYSEKDYIRIQNIASVNPVASLLLLSNEAGSREVSAESYATKLNPKFSVENIQTILYELVGQGFIYYFPEEQIIEIREKTFHYAKANTGKVDYDGIRIESNSPKTNAVFDMKTANTMIEAVENIEFSARQRVALKPDSMKVLMKQNRNMECSGKLFAGFGLFTGKNMKFDYDNFQMGMDSTRFMDFYLPTGKIDKMGQPEANSIGSRLEYLTGILVIDAPLNKSGKEDIPIFPSFNSKDISYCYYDWKATQHAAYTRDSFFFKLDKFTLNALDKLKKSDLTFKGRMYSSDIFPVFKDSIKIRDFDFSLGFIHKIPEGGYPTYKAKGNFKGTVDLSNRGFFGDGTVGYLTAKIDSDSILYKPKQMTCSADKFDMTEDRTSPVKVPQAKGYDVDVNWLPYRDSMYVTSKEKPFEIFKAPGYTLKGLLILTPDGLNGRGLFDWKQGILESKLMNFQPFAVLADTAAVKIKALEREDIILDTRNVNANVDFDNLLAQFKANRPDVVTTLPLNQYLTTMNEFTWDMRAHTINFKSPEGKLNDWTSIDPEQDSLWFQAKTAIYDMKSNGLAIGGVPVIRSCDAFIYTETGDIDIQSGGVISGLKNARIVCDTTTKHHVINRCEVDVKGKKHFTGKGFYEYNIFDRTQEIAFDDIVGQRHGEGQMNDKDTYTTAKGEKSEADGFFIDHKTQFHGTVNLRSDRKNLYFEGWAKLDCPQLPSANWFSLNAEGDKQNLVIKYDEPKNNDGSPVFTGFWLSKELAQMYPRVMMSRLYSLDRPILGAKGVFRYDKPKDVFIFGDSLRVVGNANKGNLVRYTDFNQTLEGDGKLNLCSGLKYISVTAAGKLKSSVSASADSTMSYGVTGDFMAALDAYLPEELLRIMAADIKAGSFDAKDINYTADPFFENSLANIIEDPKIYAETVQKMKTAVLTLPKPGGAKTPFPVVFFAKVPVAWNSDYQSFVSSDDKIAIAAVNGEPINKILTGYVEFKMPSNEDDRFYCYLKLPTDIYYFIGYQAGVLSLNSTNIQFMAVLEKMKAKDLTKKMPDGETYEIQSVNDATAQMFVNRVKAARKK